MSKADLTGHRKSASSPDNGGRGGGVVRSAERRDDRGNGVFARSRPDLGKLKPLTVIEVRENARQASSQHGLPGPGRAGQEKMMAAGRGDFESPAGVGLSPHFFEIHFRFGWNFRWHRYGSPRTFAQSHRDCFSQRLDAAHRWHPSTSEAWPAAAPARMHGTFKSRATRPAASPPRASRTDPSRANSPSATTPVTPNGYGTRSGQHPQCNG